MIARQERTGPWASRERARALLYKNAQMFSVLGMLALLILFFSATTDQFLTAGNALNLLRQYAPTFIVAVAMTFVITSAGIDLSVGALAALTGALAASMLGFGQPSWLTILAMLVLGLAAGAVHGWFTAYQGIPALIVTLAGLTAWRGVAQLLTQGYYSFQGINAGAFYHRSPVEEALPVDISPYDDRVEVPDGAVAEVLEPEHQILAGISGEWPVLLGYNRVESSPGSRVLARVNEDPLLVVGEPGSGRALAWTSDIGPHWCPEPFASWDGYRILWNQAVGWLCDANR
jgi:hypothetical protein